MASESWGIFWLQLNNEFCTLFKLNCKMLGTQNLKLKNVPRTWLSWNMERHLVPKILTPIFLVKRYFFKKKKKKNYTCNPHLNFEWPHAMRRIDDLPENGIACVWLILVLPLVDLLFPQSTSLFPNRQVAYIPNRQVAYRQLEITLKNGFPCHCSFYLSYLMCFWQDYFS